MSEEEPMIADEPKAEEPAVDFDPDWGDDISEDKDGGLFKKILSPGVGSDNPMAGDEVTVHYTGRLLSGEVFDSSVDRGEYFKFKLGEGAVIKGWDQGVATMTKGEKCILTCKPEYAYGEQGSMPKIPPNATLQFEVELFSWQGEDITGDGGVLKNILTKGETYSKPTDGSIIQAHIRGTYQGQVFNEDDYTFEYGEGAEQGIPVGVEKAIGKMSKHETARITVQPNYGYGEEGNISYNIPGNAELIYEVRINNFTKVKEPWDYDSFEERMQDTERIKEKGTKYFKQAKYELATKLYKRGSELITDTHLRKAEMKDQAKPLRIAFHLNLAACYLKLRNFQETISECNDALQDDDTSIKAYFRRGQARVQMQEFSDAISDFQAVLKHDPQNKAAHRELAQAKNKAKAFTDKEKRRYAKMFEYMAKESEETEPSKKQEESSKADGESSKADEESSKAEEVEASEGDKVNDTTTQPMET